MPLGEVVGWIFGVLFLLIVASWIVVLLYRLISAMMHGTKGEAALLRRRYPNGCQVCGALNREGHGCHVWAYAQRGTKLPGGGFTTSRGVPKQWRWNGWVRDRSSAIWGCAHNHWTQEQARKCAKEYVRKLQRAIVLDDITPPHPFTFHAQRVPIADLSRARWATMKRDANYCCHYCGEPSQVLQKEHRVPLSRGGLNSIVNIVPACALCNFRKGVLTDVEYFEKRKREAEREERLATRSVDGH
jgi:HNH endonuclease